VTAAVVGVIANLAVWFALHVLFAETVRVQAGPLGFDAPVPASLDPWALLLACVAALALLRLKLGVPRTLAICAVASMALHLALGVV
jgi:chromate transporter